PDHRVPLTNAAGQPVKKPKKPKIAASGRSTKGIPDNWVGFDAPGSGARRRTAKPAARKTSTKPRPR
ncbi:MAG: ATP-dependent helicase, partial [Azonexus sp.]